MRTEVLLLIPLISLAGCLSDAPADTVVLEDAVAARMAGNSTANLEKRGEWAASGGEEIDAWGDLLFVDRGSAVTILQMEHSNETLLRELATFDVPGVKDVKASDDGQYLFAGNDDPASSAPLDAVRNGGLYAFDVRDPTAPRLAATLPIGPTRGPHMVFYHQQPDGTELVLGANGDISINRFDRAKETLTELSRYAPPATDVNRDPMVLDSYYQLYAHDLFVMDDPVTGQTLMYVSNWDAGLRIVDITDPSAPVEIGAWNDFPEGHSGNLHTASTEWLGTRRITVGAVEVGFAVVAGIPYATDTEHAVVYVWDTTDPLHIRLLGTWENPDGKTAGRNEMGEPLYSTHNLQLEDGRVYMAHYELGVWVLDVSTPEAQAAPPVLAYFDEEGMNTWDVVLHQGILFTSGAVGIQALDVPWLEPGIGVSSRA